MSNEEDERMSYYIEIGAVELVGMDESGEFIFKITDHAKEVAPELWAAHQEHVENSIMELYERGLINITYDDNLEAYIEMNEEGKKAAKDMGLIETDFNDEDIPND
jgi:membrane protease subunit (stomatin/prohibitin family)